jgi:two-component system, NarL family, response regulator NreC
MQPSSRAGRETALPQSEPVIRIALVEDQRILREGLRALIAGVADLEVVADAAGIAALEAVDVEPDVVVTGLAFADAARDLVIKRIRARFPRAAIVALTVHDDLATVQLALAAGADGYVLKSAPSTDLFAGIRAVANGGLYLQPSIGIAFAAQPPEEIDSSSVGGLTPKETEVLRFLALGHTNAEIAALTGSSIRTIETHRAHIHQRLDRHTRAELVRFALDAGLLRLDEQPTHS